METREYINLINQHYWDAKKKRLSRFSVEWGKWSREMNLELRKRIESVDPVDPDELHLKYVFLYWVNRSQLLEVFFKGRLFALGLKKRLEKAGKEFCGLALGLDDSKLKDVDIQQVLLESMVPKR